MAIYIVCSVLFIILIGYIIYLRIRLAEKNVFIETTVRRLTGIEKSRSIEEMSAFLQEIQNLSQYSSIFTDKFPDENIIRFILENDKDYNIYLHYTRDESVARMILDEGFLFTESFYKTAEKVTNDMVDLLNKHNNRKYFGENIIVINISKKTSLNYSAFLQAEGLKDFSFENLLSVTLPRENENSDFEYRLAPQFIKGYINQRTGEIAENPLFDPNYDSDLFKKNIDALKNRQKGNIF